MMPSQSQIELPLLKVLADLGGRDTPQQVYPLVAKAFPEMTEADLAEVLSSGGSKWTNRVQWVRQRLISKGEVESPQYGVWAITAKGQARLREAGPAPVKPMPTDFLESYEEYEQAFRQRLKLKLLDLTPQQFEVFARVLLRAHGFQSVEVTAISRDGGIDGYGQLKVGLATMSVAFQCKRWQGNIGRPEVNKFRGAISGEYEQGLFFTTADFTADAAAASIKTGAVPIILLNGDAIVDLMIQKGFGVEKRPLELYYDRLDAILETI